MNKRFVSLILGIFIVFSISSQSSQNQEELNNANTAFQAFLEKPSALRFKLEKEHFSKQKQSKARGGYFVGTSMENVIETLKNSNCQATATGPDVVKGNIRALIQCDKDIGYDVSPIGEDLGATKNILMIFRKDNFIKGEFFIINMYPQKNLT